MLTMKIISIKEMDMFWGWLGWKKGTHSCCRVGYGLRAHLQLDSLFGKDTKQGIMAVAAIQW